jgi:hypothetical protein
MTSADLRRGALASLLFLFLAHFYTLLAETSYRTVIVNDGLLPPKTVAKIDEMGAELYEKTKVPVFVAAVADLNATKPMTLIEKIRRDYPTYVLLYLSKEPMSVNIFRSKDAEKLADYDQILSPWPWRGTIKPVMSPAFSKSEDVKIEVAIFNGFADLVDQIAASRGITLKSSIGSQSKESFLIARWIFYAILLFLVLQYFYYKRKRRAGK